MTFDEALDELQRLLHEAGARPYINTFYLDAEQRRRAFRLRSAAWLKGRRVSVRHMEFARARRPA
jgi:hypothetical protein